jgi:sirohydrochlorin ferrochelatase
LARVAATAFILATDLQPGGAAWENAEAQAASLGAFATRTLGFVPRVRTAWLPTRPPDDCGTYDLARVIDGEIVGGVSDVFVLPSTFELNVWQRTRLGQALSEARRRHGPVLIHHDDANLTHPLLVNCFVEQIVRALAHGKLAPQGTGLLLVADGEGDPATRADSYRLMRLLWEETGLGQAEIGFVRHGQPFLQRALERCLREPLNWILLPQCQWDGELNHYAEVMLASHRQSHPEAKDWRLLDPPRNHPAILAWLEQRVLNLWREKRARQAARVPSAKHQVSVSAAEVWSASGWAPVTAGVTPSGSAVLARAREPNALAEILARVLPPSERYLVKVNWHGYAPGTYTSPAALDLLLGALPGKAVLLEGHTSSRNLGGADWNWETDAERHRAWIRRQDTEFLRRTGMTEVIARHGAQYVNVTEEWWDGACAPQEQVRSALGDVTIQRTELAGFVPSVLMEHRGMPLLSVARFKGPTRLGISNLFGLIPHPLRTAWHGPNITFFASVCCDLARLYGRLFPLFGLVEALESAVRWDRKGLYRSRWGNYDLVLTDGLFTLSEGLVGADLLASRLQGQDVLRSAFYDVIRDRLGWPSAAATAPLPVDVQAMLA